MSDPNPIRNGIHYVVDIFNDVDTTNIDNGNSTTLSNTGSCTVGATETPISSSGSNGSNNSDVAAITQSNRDPPAMKYDSTVVVAGTASFILPNGQLMDGKNTLQSFDVAPAVKVSSPIASAVVPSPLERNVNNSLNRGIVTPTGVHVGDVGLNYNATSTGGNERLVTGETRRNDGTALIATEAVAVQSFALVDAELANSQIKVVPPSKRTTTFWLVVVVLIIISTCLATAAGVYCGTGNCGGSSSMQPTSATISRNGNDSSDGNPHTQNQSTFSPTISPPSTLSNNTQDQMTSHPTVTTSTFISPSTIVTIGTATPSSPLPVNGTPGTIVPSGNATTGSSSIFITPSNYPTITSAPTKSPVLVPATESAPTEELVVACNFLGFTNLTECQIQLSFEGMVMGNTIPSEIGWLTQLTHLDWSVTDLTGTIPATIGNLQQLTYLNCSTNALTGHIPVTMGNLTQLQTLDLNSNALSSSIPSTLGNLEQLTYLRLSSNSLTGTIPSSLGNLEQLTALILLFNTLTGTLPSALGHLLQLNFFTVSYNQLVGPIPSTLGNLTHLTYMGFDVNQLTGPIPSTFGNLIELTDLNFGSNQFTGTIPLTLGKLTNLTFLFLHDNPWLGGTVPPALCSVSRKYIAIDCENGNITCSCCVDDLSGTPC